MTLIRSCSVGIGAIALLSVAVVISACSSGVSSASSDAGKDASSGSGSTRGTGSGSGSGSHKDAGESGSGSGSSGGHAGLDAGVDAALLITPGLSKVGTGEYETFYLKDGIIYAYGGGSPTLGLGSYMGISIPPRQIATPANLKFIDVQGGLHQSMAIDVNHHVWTWGVAASSGSADAGVNPTTPFMVTVDNKGNPFDGIVAIEPTQYYNSVLKSDGTVWVWGDCHGGITGDGTAGGPVATPTEVPIPLPPSVTITKISGGNALTALASDGSVWAWGPAEDGVLGTGNTTDGTVPRKVLGLPADIVAISVGGSDWFYALTGQGELYGWGFRNPYLGIPGYAPVLTAMSLKTVLNLPAPVKMIVADSLASHAILTDGTLWGWGDAACGGVGNGEEPNWNATTCGWDFMAYDDMIYQPVQIAPGVSNFTQIFANSAYDFYVYAQTGDGKLYSWGRNKGGTLGNGVYAAAADGNVGTAADIAGNHANSWDVPLATLVTPFATPPKGTLSPCCPAGQDAAGCQ